MIVIEEKCIYLHSHRQGNDGVLMWENRQYSFLSGLNKRWEYQCWKKRDFILDNGLTESDTLLLNQVDFDDLAIEYRKTYNDSIFIPYFLLRILVQDDRGETFGERNFSTQSILPLQICKGLRILAS